MTPHGGRLRLAWLRLRLSGLTMREAERWLRQKGGMSRSAACEYVSKNKHSLGLRNV